MNYLELNRKNRNHISGVCNSDTHFEWEDYNFMEYLLGGLPKLKSNFSGGQTPSKFLELSNIYRTYSFMKTDATSFLDAITTLATAIGEEYPRWSGLNLSLVEEVLHSHKFCLITGEGGIGKSYFIKCFEQELSKRNIKHLCVYGKFNKNISDIDFEEIIRIGEYEEFVFAFDAINEISGVCQETLLKELQKLKPFRGIRIVITCRSHTIDESIFQSYRNLAEMVYTFPGVSFESAVEWLRKMPVEDITEYLDVLYSNSPFLLGKLRYILENGWDGARNNVSRFTYIYEQYIKRALSSSAWKQTKLVARFMYQNDKKEVSSIELAELLDSSQKYISDMEQAGFLTRYTYSGVDYCSFLIESLADYLIARSMLEDLKDKTQQERIDIIKVKVEKIHGISEMVILLLFDLYSPNYAKIKEMLSATDLLSEFDYDLIVKIHFAPNNIAEFLKHFAPTHPEILIEYFAGYTNKPFNCTNFLNEYYLENEIAHTQELSRQLSRKHFLERLKSRLKNALYLICKYPCSDDRLRETFYTAIWCTAAGNQEIRSLAKKLLYDVLQQLPSLIDEVIELFPRIKDYYIQEAIIDALSSCSYRQQIKDFFVTLLSCREFTLGVSIRKICEYLEQPNYYIELDKANLFSEDNTVVSEDFKDFLFRIDLFEKELLPFRFWGVASFQESVKFLATDKQKISEFNKRVAADFSCVQGGTCSGSLGFHRKVEQIYSISISDEKLNGTAMLASLEKTFRKIFSIYGLKFEINAARKQDEQDFSASLLRKCTCIAIDIFYGSLMCNYYTKEFATFNTAGDTIGFEVYNPLEYRDDIHIRSPLSVFQPQVEKMGDLVLSVLDFPLIKNKAWWSDLDNVKSNILKLLTPITHKGHEWIMISGRIFIHGESGESEWKDTYDLFCCTSLEETLKNDGNERFLTIELDEYSGNLFDYRNTSNRPWLCKRVPTISYNALTFEDTILTLPPATIISTLGLRLNTSEMSWEDSNGNAIIICNNNKSSYYRDSIMGTVFLRKDAYEQLVTLIPLKFFAFSERYLAPMGYCDDTAMHFEIVDGKIEKAFLNYNRDREYTCESPPVRCMECKYGFYKPLPEGYQPDILLKEKLELKDLLREYGSQEL